MAHSLTNTILMAIDQFDRVFTLAATNLPWMIDNAMRRRITKRIYVGLPNLKNRVKLIEMSLKGKDHAIYNFDMDFLAEKYEGYSCDDIANIVDQAQKFAWWRTLDLEYFTKEYGTKAVWQPCGSHHIGATRVTGKELEARKERFEYIKINMADFEEATRMISQTVSQEDCERLLEYNREFGSFKCV